MIPAPSLRELILWLLGRRLRLRVTGRSMVPILNPGDLVFINPRSQPTPDSVIAIWHPDKPDLKIIKRIESVSPNGRLILASDNPAEGQDSRHFGPVDRDAYIGTITSRIA